MFVSSTPLYIKHHMRHRTAKKKCNIHNDDTFTIHLLFLVKKSSIFSKTIT